METPFSKSVVVFDQPFKVTCIEGTLPAGEYVIVTELASPPDRRDPEAWKASVVVRLSPRKPHSGMRQGIIVSLLDLDKARARDQLTGKQVSEVFLEEMLADPMVQLVMRADGVSEAHLRSLYLGSKGGQV